MWIDISHTVKVAELKGGRLMKNLDTGETCLEGVEVAPLSPEHHFLLDSAEQEYLEQRAKEMAVPEVPATTTQARSKGRK